MDAMSAALRRSAASLLASILANAAGDSVDADGDDEDEDPELDELEVFDSLDEECAPGDASTANFADFEEMAVTSANVSWPACLF
jgi:hypothetical protein